MNPVYKKARLRAEIPPEGLPDSFWVITVCNPGGVTIPGEENGVRTEAFRAQLLDHGLRHFPVMGYDPDSPHREPGFGVVCERAIALSFGRQWEQEAIFHVHQGEVILVSCGETGEECSLGSWVSKADVT
jgi:hypothetical protein